MGAPTCAKTIGWFTTTRRENVVEQYSFGSKPCYNRIPKTLLFRHRDGGLVEEALHNPRTLANRYRRDGYVCLKAFSDQDMSALRQFVSNWLNEAFNITGNYDFTTYHNWFSTRGIKHEQVLVARNRHTVPPLTIASVLRGNAELNELLSVISNSNKFDVWDEGLGWLGFRVIRPRPYDDGYPLSKKEWGPAGSKVISVSVPVFFEEPAGLTAFLPGSHRREFDSYLPANSHFCRDERRLLPRYEEEINRLLERPCTRAGEAVVFNAKTIHTESPDITATMTRVSIEWRYAAIG